MRFINLTRRTEIGANCYFLELDGHGLILDSGMHPKYEGDEALPNFQPIGARDIEAILVSHAHQDHIGTLPVLMTRHPQARVFMTEATGDIGLTLLHNSVNVMTRQREELGVPTYPLFTHRGADRVADRWQFCPLHQRISLGGERVRPQETDVVSFELFDAGHVLGSTGILLRANEGTVFYTGDVNFDDQTIMQAAAFPDEKVDVLIMECTRGDSATPPEWTRRSEEDRLAAAITDAFARGGCVLIPVFALGKTQELLAMLYRFRREKLLGDFPVYIGGLSSKFSTIYGKRAPMTRRNFQRLQLLPEVSPFVLNGQTINETPARAGRIYALSSGMMTPKTLSNTFARRVVENPQHFVFFIGYADPDSPGGRLRDAAPESEVQLDPDDPPQRVRCQIKQFQFSAHATRESLVAFAKKMAPRKILLVHGDLPAVEWMRASLAKEVPGSEVIVPQPGVELGL